MPALIAIDTMMLAIAVVPPITWRTLRTMPQTCADDAEGPCPRLELQSPYASARLRRRECEDGETEDRAQAAEDTAPSRRRPQ